MHRHALCADGLYVSARLQKEQNNIWMVEVCGIVKGGPFAISGMNKQ
jgi:hypothetical protein